MIEKFKKIAAFISAIAMLGTTATVLPEGMSFDFGTGITASAAGTEQQSTDEASVTINEETLYYATLEEAFSAADGKIATITMLNDAECTVKSGSPISVMNKSNITLNMNGKTLSGQGTGDCGIITLATGSLSVQGPGTMKSTFKCLSCQSKNAKMTVENITFDVSEADYGVWVVSSNTVTLNNIQIIGKAKTSAVYQYSKSANVTINNMNAIDGGYSDVCFKGNTLKINGGTFDKISVNSYYVASITSVSQVLGEGCIYRYADKTWETSELSNTLEISNVTVEKIPLTMNPEAKTSWYYNSAEHSLHMNAQPTTTGNEITYEWYDGDKKLECVSDTYTVPKTTSIGSYTYTCKATCDGYTLSHEFTFTVEECKHEGVEITFNSNGFGNCPKCNATVYQPATETTDKYDIDDDSTKEAVYEISNAGQLYWFAGLVNGTLDGVEQNTSANAILTANITANENLLNSLQYDAEGNVSNGSDFISWTPIGNYINEYSGIFDGNNKTVSGLYFNDNSTRIGLFGSSDAYGNIKNVGVVDSYFKGNDFVGGVCGRNDGTITNCYNTGKLTLTEDSAEVGGVCGYNDGTVINCYNTGNVTATGLIPSVGGVCGLNIRTISNCYNIGTVTATDSEADVGGVCGVDYGSITNCYYLADTDDENDGKTAAQFASGEVAYLLSQGENGSVWGQNLATENYPLLNGKTVYQVDSYEGCIGNPGNSTKVYSNTDAPIYAEHNYSNGGICNVCNALENGKDGFKSASVSLTDGVIVNYNVILSDEVIKDENAYINFKSESGINKNIKFSEAVLTGETYKFSLELRPDQMSEIITAQVIYGDGTEGNSVNFSIKEYSENLENETDKKLADSMKLYGAFAQVYTGRKTDNLVSDIKDYETNATIGEEYNYSLTENASGIKTKSATLQIGSQVTIVVKYQLEEGKNISGYTFTCGDKSLEPVKNGDYYCVYLRNILPQDLDKMYEIVVKDKSNAGNETTLKYSAFSYMKSAFEKSDSEKKLTNLLNAMYDYNKAAEEKISRR